MLTGQAFIGTPVPCFVGHLSYAYLGYLYYVKPFINQLSCVLARGSFLPLFVPSHQQHRAPARNQTLYPAPTIQC
jgi:hypothetical protein